MHNIAIRFLLKYVHILEVSRMTKNKMKFYFSMIYLNFIIQQLYFANAELISLTIGAGAVGALSFFITDFGGLYSYAKCKCMFNKN
jgi:hypothetical protein